MSTSRVSWHIGSELDSLYKHVFELAEKKRWWRLDVDIAWDRISLPADADTVELVETLWAVESFLPDYTATVAAMHRAQRGRAWVHTLWAYEESRHSRALEEWLIRSGGRTAANLEELSQLMWQGHFHLPYSDHRKLLVYQMLQEGVTRLFYSNMRVHARSIGDGALADVCRLIAADEMTHYGFFRDLVMHHLRADPDGTISDLYSVLLEFEMPARNLVPGFPRRDALYKRMHLMSIRAFVEDVWLRSADHLGIDPLPPELRYLRKQGMEMGELLGLLEDISDMGTIRSMLFR